MANILLIDGNDVRRAALLQMLVLDGHHVSEAADGDAGLHAFGKPGGFQLVVADPLLPALDGTRVIVELRRRRPGQPIIGIVEPDQCLSAVRQALAGETS